MAARRDLRERLIPSARERREQLEAQKGDYQRTEWAWGTTPFIELYTNSWAETAESRELRQLADDPMPPQWPCRSQLLDGVYRRYARLTWSPSGIDRGGFQGVVTAPIDGVISQQPHGIHEHVSWNEDQSAGVHQVVDFQEEVWEDHAYNTDVDSEEAIDWWSHYDENWVFDGGHGMTMEELLE